MSTLKDNLSMLQEKAKERTVKTQSIEYDLETLVKKIENKIIKLNPEYQRRHRWNDDKSSKLIESLILNIPIPVVYLSQDVDVDTETENARYSVIDGQQRLTAIKHYFENIYPLKGLKSLDTLNGSYYSDLPPFLIRRLEERVIRCIRIDSTVDSQVKIDIFERLNSGSTKLESQELRNAVYRGPFNDLCKQLAENINFRQLLQIKKNDTENNPKVKKMEDTEDVLRFFTLIDGKYKNYKKTKEKGFKDFLSDELNAGNDYDPVALDKLKSEFEKTMETILKSFGPSAFEKYKLEENELKWKSSFNTAVFDALSVAVHSKIIIDNEELPIDAKSRFISLFKDEQFQEAVSSSTLNSAKLTYRIEEAIKVLKA